jgi:hypothetical protein
MLWFSSSPPASSSSKSTISLNCTRNQEPPVNLGQVEDLLDGEPGAKGVAEEENAFGVGDRQFARDDVAREDVQVCRAGAAGRSCP